MVGKNNQYLKSTKEGTRVESYSIKKFKVGAASVVIGASIFLGIGTVAQASEQVSDNTTTKNTTDTDTKVTKEEAPKAATQPTKVENTKESVAAEVAAKVGAETPKAEEATKVETKSADKTALKASIDNLEQKLSSVKNADEAVVKAAREELAKAKAVFAKADATQEEVDAKVAALKALNSTVVESNAKVTAEKEEAKKEEEKAKSEEKQTEEVKEAKKELTQVTSEAEVTNVLANEAIHKNEVKIEAKPAVEKAVAKNEEVIKVANELLGNDETTKEQIAKSLEELSNSIKAVYAELENAGVRRDGRYGVALSANEGYTLSSTELRKENGEFETATGKTYKELDGNPAYKIYVKGFQSENTEEVAKNNPQPGTGARTDLPLSKTEAQKLGREAAMWNNKLRASGQNNNKNPYGSGGGYEYLATEIYGYTYEQGNHYVYLKDVTKRFDLNDEAKAAGYTIKSVTPLNLPPGLGYNAATDTVEGYVGASIQNGVYDFRYELTVAKGDTEQKVFFRDLQAGWIGWQDSTAPRIQGSSTMVTIGEDVSHELQYVDNDGVNKDTRANYQREDGSKFVAGSKTAPNSSGKKAEFVAADGTTVKSMNSPQTVTAYTTLNGKTNGTKPVSLDDTIPGLTYAPETGLITGKPTEAGIFTVAALAKDYNSASAWNMNGQEAHENITIAVAPKITVKNVEAYATSVPVTISNGANKAEITTPDGEVTKLVVKDGNWVVAAGTTNTAVQEGTVLAPVATSGESTINLTVTPEATKYVGVDSIAAKATTDKVQAYLQRETVKVKDHNQKEYVATFNRATGKYSLPVEDAYHIEENGDNTILTERRVYTEAQPNGDVKLFVYEFTRTWNAKSSATNLVDKVAEVRKNGEVTAVGDVFRTETLLPNDQTSSTQGRTIKVNYDSVTNQWTASDGSKVTATETGAGWKVSTDSGFNGYIAFREAVGSDLASIQNAKPTGTSTSYSEAKGTSVDLIKSTKANVAFADTIDDKSSATDSDTIKTKVTATAPDGTVTTFDGAQAEETAYIQAQRSAAEKTQAAAQAVKEKQEEQNKLASLQERLDRQIRMVEDAQTALDNLKLRTISPTAEEMAQRMLNVAKEIKVKLEADIEAAKGNVATLDSKVTATRTEAVKAEKAVETARTALKTAAEANLAKANAYVLSQKGRYKVTARAVDSNGVVTTPTVGGTDAGEVTEDAVAETTYYIVVTDPEKSSGAQGQKQTDSMVDNFNDGKEGTTVSDYKLVDPKTGNKVSSVTTDQGTYTVDPDGTVHFTPDPQFKGKGTTMTVVRKDQNGTPVTAEYTAVVHPASPEGTEVETAGVQGKVQSGRPNFIGGKVTIDGVEKTVEIDNNVPAKLIDPKTGQEVTTVTIDGEGTYTVAEDGTVTFTPDKNFKGKGTELTVKRVDKNGTPALGKYSAVVVGVKPTAEPSVTSDIQGQTQSQPVKFKGGVVEVENPMTKVKTEEVVAIDPTTYTLLDENGQPATEVPAKDPQGNVVGKYTLVKEDGKDPVAVFTPTDKTYAGEVKPVTVQAKDTNGTAVTTTYTPNITPVTPTAKGTTSEGAQGQEQSGTPTFTEGHEKAPIDKTVPAKLIDPETGEPTDETSVEVPGEGTYTINPETGEVTFKPEPNFTGKAQGIEVQRKDTNGTPATAKYTPTVKPVTPKSDDVVSEDVQGAKQTGTPVFTPGKTTVNGKDVTVEIDETVKPTFEDGSTTKEVPGEGTYTIDENGVVTFTPEPQFTGKASGVTVKRVDKNGTEVTAKYTPTVKPVTPTADGVTTTDVQGAKQTGKPEFEAGKTTVNGVEKTVDLDDTKPATFEDGSTTKEVPGEGTYTVAPDGTVTFTPNKDFTGQATGVTVKRVDKNGTPVTAKYTPVVLPVTPTGKDVTSIGEKGQPQSETPVFTPGTTKVNGKTVTVPIDETVAPTLEGADKDGKVVVPGEGTYTIDKNGKVTFTPEKDFVGKAKGVTVKRVDENGTPVTAKYTPTVLGKTTTENVVSEGAKGQPQSNTPVFKGDVDTTVAPTFKDGSTTKEVPGEGTYTIDATGKVTFTPEPNFVGTATPVEVVRKDKNGKTIKASYTPTVRPDTKFVVVGKDGKETEIIPSKDGKNPSEKISGYKLVKTETDEKGNTKHIYEPVTTKHVDRKGNPIPGTTTEEGTKDPKNIPGYKVVDTKKLPNGDTEYVYEKVTTSFVDSQGRTIPGTETEEGTTPKKDIPGYKFVETKTLENGDTEHVYEPVTTKHLDKNGNPIPGTETEEGTTSAKTPKEVPGYKLVDTKKLPNGDTEYIYEKVTTVFKDKDGNVIPGTPTEEGTTPKKDIPGYRFVETKTLPNGDTEHVYEKVNTVFKDKDGNVIPGTTTEAGEQPKKDIPGYKFVTTNKLPNGDVEHVYEKVTTPSVEKQKELIRDTEGNVIPGFEFDMLSPVLDIPEYQYVETVTDPDGTVRHVYRAKQTIHRDTEGNPIPNVPKTEKGTKDPKKVPGYKVVDTKKLPNGDTEYIYEKVKPSTTWTDENGNPLKPSANGSVDAGSIEGYEYAGTVVDEDGNVRHIFKKSTRIPATNIVTTWTDENGNPLRPSENGAKGMGTVEGYEFVRTVVDENGNIRHIFRKVTAATPKAQVKRLANTGSETSNTAAAGFGVLLAGIAAAIRKRRKED